MRIFLIVVSILICLGSLWGGAWLLHVFPPSSPYNFPAYITTCTGVVVGGLLAWINITTL